jgi:hypothetical protein
MRLAPQDNDNQEHRKVRTEAFTFSLPHHKGGAEMVRSAGEKMMQMGRDTVFP